jgi:hypothetical protein
MASHIGRQFIRVCHLLLVFHKRLGSPNADECVSTLVYLPSQSGEGSKGRSELFFVVCRVLYRSAAQNLDSFRNGAYFIKAGGPRDQSIPIAPCTQSLAVCPGSRALPGNDH